MARDDGRPEIVTSPILSLQRLSMAYSDYFKLASRCGSDGAVAQKLADPYSGISRSWSDLKHRLTDAVRVCKPRGIAVRELEQFAGEMELYVHVPSMRPGQDFSIARSHIRAVVDLLSENSASDVGAHARIASSVGDTNIRVNPKRSPVRNDTLPARSDPTVQTSSPGRPGLFLGSSAEHVEQVAALTLLLTRHFEVIAWSDSAFGAGRATIDELIRLSKRVRYAAFIVDADDTAAVRNSSKLLARDNVVFELGLFMGALSPERVFMIYDTNKRPDLASDLAGITPIEYFPHSHVGEWHHALSPAATQILNAKTRIEQAAN